MKILKLTVCSKGLPWRLLRIWFCLAGAVLSFALSCSNDNGPAAAKCPETSSHIQTLAPGKEIDSMSTVQSMLVAAGQDPCIFLWDWANLEQPARKIPIERLAWVPPRDRSERYLPLNRTSVWMPPDCVVYASEGGMGRTVEFKEIRRDPHAMRLMAGGLWRCRQLRVTRNGKFSVVLLDGDAIHWVEGVNVRGDNRAYRLGFLNAEQGAITWLPTFFRPDLLLPDISSVAISEYGKYIAVVGTFNRGWISLVDATTGKVLWEKRPQEKDLLYGKWTVNFNDVCFSDDGKLIYVAGNCGLFCFDIADGKILKQWPDLGRVMRVAVSPDGRLVAGGEVGSVYVCDAKTGENVARPILKLRTNQLTTTGLAFSPDSTLLATCGVGRNGIKIWEMPKADREGESEGAEGVE